MKIILSLIHQIIIEGGLLKVKSMSAKNSKSMIQIIYHHSGKLLKSYALDFIILLIVALLLITLFVIPANAQNIGVNNAMPHPKALLDLASSDKGLLTTRLTEAQRTAMFPAADWTARGMIVYQTDNATGFWYYDGSVWKQIVTGQSGWITAGNAGTVDGTNFLGTTDNVPLSFRVNNTKAGRIDQILHNTFLGYLSGSGNTAGSANVFVGDSAGTASTTGSENTFVGVSAGKLNGSSWQNACVGSYSGANATGSGNSFLGYGSGRNCAGGLNCFLGAYSGSSNSGDKNVFIGYATGYYNTFGYDNTYVGAYAGDLGINGHQNFFGGTYAGMNNVSASDNVFIGHQSGYSNISSGNNTFVGSQSGYLNAGINNTYLGYAAGNSSTTGNYNTYVGSNAHGSPTISGSSAIGVNANVTVSGALVLGGTGVDAVKVGIGTTAPTAELEVNGFTKLGDATVPAIKIKKLTCNSSTLQGSSTFIAHGLTASKILSVDILLEYSAGSFIHPSYTYSNGYEFNYYITSTGINVANVNGNSALILNKPVKILITYEQ